MHSEYWWYFIKGPPNPDNVPEDGKLKSSHIAGGTRRYYLDLKENQRGRFLRVSQTQTRGGPRSQIAIPAQGMDEFKDTLSGLLDVYGIDDHGKYIVRWSCALEILSWGDCCKNAAICTYIVVLIFFCSQIVHSKYCKTSVLVLASFSFITLAICLLLIKLSYCAI